jgi:hypothetical protein
MVPLIPKDLLITAVEMVCYFCTVIAALTYMLTARR